MSLRITASMLTLLCSWVLWEKQILYKPGPPGTERFITAVHESSTLLDCRIAMPKFSKEKAAEKRESYPEREYSVTHGDTVVTVMVRGDKNSIGTSHQTC